MRKTFITALIICVATAAQAQTARIAHRSHSGAHKTFNAKSGDHFGMIMEHPQVEKPLPKPRAADTVKVIKVKPWVKVKDTLPPAVNPIYTKKQKQPAKIAPAKVK